MLKNQKGIVLVVTYLSILVLLILGSFFITRSISEKRIADAEKDSIQAFYLAEAGIDRALEELRANYTWSGTGAAVTLGNGQYSVSVNTNGNEREVTSIGFIPDAATFRIRRFLEVNVKQSLPPANFYDNAIYASKEVDFNGNAYLVDGKVIYGEGPISDTDNVTGTVTQDDSASPLAQLNFAQLYSISQAQGNVYDEDRLDDVKKGNDSFPASFWFDEFTNTPNIVYVESNLELKGNVGTIGGFFVVVGDVITNPGGSTDTSINGNGEIAGCIYTTGKFRVNGGGGGLNVNGGVWANEEVELNGNATVTYNEDYMNAINDLNLTPDIQLLSWREVF